MKQVIKSNLHQLIDEADNILLLQGPVGAFFYTLSVWLTEQHGKTVHKFNFNAGDEYFYPNTHPYTSAYTDTYEQFISYLEHYITLHEIQAVVCFGDTRLYHQAARGVAEKNGISFWAFEEGYFRPSLITLEKNGVNAYSSLPKDAGFFLENLPLLEKQGPYPPQQIGGGFLAMAAKAMRYYLYARLGKRRYPNYIHHRRTALYYYIRLWFFSWVKHLRCRREDATFAKYVEAGHGGKFFVLPLQVFNDSQVRVHCDFSTVHNFLFHVLDSFAQYAPDDVNIVVKHHPMDRGFVDYEHDIRQFICKHPRLEKRIRYVHDVPLPILLRHGIGMITINSTSGLSALIHNMPVKVLGRASYDIPNITYQGKLADFWHNPTPPDKAAFHAYRMYHLNVTQINGSFYSSVNFPNLSVK